MTRKRFVKNLMGKGLPRNKAERFAAALRNCKIPYKLCEIENVVKCSDGVHRGTCTFPKEIARMLSQPRFDRAKVRLIKTGPVFELYGTEAELGMAKRISEIKIGADGRWNYPEHTQWLRAKAEELRSQHSGFEHITPSLGSAPSAPFCS